jgi:hypothetical protein
VIPRSLITASAVSWDSLGNVESAHDSLSAISIL